MIDNNLIQAAIVTKLKANAALVGYLTQFGAQDEIRESQYQAAGFLYPNVRVELGTQIEEGNPPCYSTTPFTVYSYSEKDSSQEANQLAGYVNRAFGFDANGAHTPQAVLVTGSSVGSSFHSGIIISDGSIAARRVSERVWQAVGLYRMNIYGGTP